MEPAAVWRALIYYHSKIQTVKSTQYGNKSFDTEHSAGLTADEFVAFHKGKHFKGNTPEDEEAQLRDVYALCCKDAGVEPKKAGKPSKPDPKAATEPQA